MVTNLDPIFNVEEEEYALSRVAFKPVPSGTKIQLNVPKVTGNITEIGVAPVNGQNIFINSPECKPVIQKKVMRKNTISAIVKENCIWLDKLNSAGLIPAGSLFVVEFTNCSLIDPFATTK